MFTDEQYDAMTETEKRAAIEQLRAENAALKANGHRNGNGLSIMLGKQGKGNVSVYGLGRFPVTLYAGQWEKLLSHAGQITAFIETNRASLSTK